MIEAISAAVPTPAVNGAAVATPSVEAASPSAVSSAEPAQAATRAYVDRSDSGVYVYRLVDVATGRVLAELPRMDGGALKLSQDYRAGAAATQTV